MQLNNFPRKKVSYYLDWLCFLLLPVFLSIPMFGSKAYASTIVYAEYSLLLLKIIVFIKPVLVIVGHPIQYTLLHFRRHLGISAFRLALFHAGGILFIKGWWSIELYYGLGNYLFWGLISFIGILILGATTNYYSIKRLGKRWKHIQYIAYPVLFMTLLHEAMMPITITLQGYEKVYQVGIVFIVFITAKSIEYLIKQKKIPSICTYIQKNQ